MNICTFLLVKLIKSSLQLDFLFHSERQTIGAARGLNLSTGTGTARGDNTFVFWSGSASFTLNITTVVKDFLHIQAWSSVLLSGAHDVHSILAL